MPDAKKLLKLTLSLGGGTTKTVFAGIKEAYKPEDLVGRLVICVANLAPRKMKFGTSEGMVDAAGTGRRQRSVRHHRRRRRRAGPARALDIADPSGSDALHPGQDGRAICIDRVRFEVFQIAKRQRRFVRGGEDDFRRMAGVERFLPARAHRHQRSPGCRPGKPHCRLGVERSLPAAFENARNSAVITTQTVCEPTSSGPVLQQPSRKKPVMGDVQQVASLPPSTFLAFGRRTTPLD